MSPSSSNVRQPNKTDKNWKGPHSPVRSPDLLRLCRGKYLTNHRIETYIRSGHYGEAAQQRLAELEQQKKANKHVRKPRITLEFLGL